MYPVELSGRVERGSITNQREESVEMGQVSVPLAQPGP